PGYVVKWQFMKAILRHWEPMRGWGLKFHWPLVFDLIEELLDCAPAMMPDSIHLAALQQSFARYPNIAMGRYSLDASDPQNVVVKCHGWVLLRSRIGPCRESS
ncbi:MAG TPA: hypothetical protein VEW66_02845, partial [Thermomicrobiales bacterium]|nr:hypothetical protein [Thermomicrobiales bacterium]